MKGINHIALIAICFVSTLSQAAVIDDYAVVSNDRFANSTSFIGSEYDWSGVGMTPGGKWATLVGPNTVISAHHLRPSGMVMFYPENDSSADPVVLRITEGHQLNGTDLWVGCLEEYAPSSITPFHMATETLTTGSFADSLLNGAEVLMTGRSPSLYPAQVDQAVGRNVVTTYAEDTATDLGTNVDTLRMVYDAAQSSGDTSPYREFETHLEVGDSGAPVFTDVNGELVLIGISSFITTSVQGQVTASHASYVGNESEAIEDFISVCIASVPEPATGGMLLFSFAAIFAMRRKR